MNYKIALLIPTYNAGEKWKKVLKQIPLQTQRPDKVIVIDSESTDHTVDIARRHGADVMVIPKKDFTHGYARHKMVAEYPEFDIYILLTQDAILASEHSIETLVKAFDNPAVGVAFGRQKPYPEAGIIETHNRNFNYPDQSSIKSKKDIPAYGFKTIFCSNSFAAYRKTAYDQTGGFPLEANFGEDTLLCAKMILSDWEVAYVADANIYHSHNNSLLQDFKRFYEIGLFHKKNPWLYTMFGKPSGEGLRYLTSQVKFVLKRNPLLLPAVVIRTINKFIAYKSGLQLASR